MGEGNKTVFKEDTRKLVPCRGVKYSPLIPLEECQKCEWHGGFKPGKPAKNNLPPIELIVCKVPMTVRISYLVEGDIPDKGRKPVRTGGD